MLGISCGCGCQRPRCGCGQSVFAPAPNFGYNVQHPVLVPNEPSHRVDFHPEYWQFPQVPGYGGLGYGGPGFVGPGFAG